MICPLKVGLECAATAKLAAESRCIGCPLLTQCDLVDVYLQHHADRNDAPLLKTEASA